MKEPLKNRYYLREFRPNWFHIVDGHTGRAIVEDNDPSEPAKPLVIEDHDRALEILEVWNRPEPE